MNMQTKNRHQGEVNTSRADKMSGSNRIKTHEKEKLKDYFKKGIKSKFPVDKKFNSKKRRMFLKNPLFFNKI